MLLQQQFHTSRYSDLQRLFKPTGRGSYMLFTLYMESASIPVGAFSTIQPTQALSESAITIFCIYPVFISYNIKPVTYPIVLFFVTSANFLKEAKHSIRSPLNLHQKFFLKKLYLIRFFVRTDLDRNQIDLLSYSSYFPKKYT